MDRIWTVLTDIERLPTISPSVVSVERITPEPFGVGTRWQLTRGFVGRDEIKLMTVVEATPPRLVAVDATLGDRDYRLTVTLTPDADVTHVRYTYEPTMADTSPAERLVRHLGRMLSDLIYEANLQRELDGLREAVEQPDRAEAAPISAP